MITETAAVKAALYVGAAAVGYLALDRFCDNAGIQEPLSATAKVAVRFCKNLSNEFNCGGDSADMRALRARAEIAAREAYANVMAQQMVANNS